MPIPPFTTNRRAFLKGISAVTAGGIFLPHILRAQEGAPAGKRLAIGCIGVGGKGGSDMNNAAKENDIVAICDVDEKNLAKAGEKHPNAKRFRDFRKMLDEVKEIDGVTISTPDHSHYPAAMHAIALGKHVCIQKPLVNTLWEGRQLELAAKKKGVITQMGNQGHTYDDNRLLKEWIDAGVVGKVKEIHVWTNRPVWPQGKVVAYKTSDVPATVDWPLWLAGTPDHAYSPDIHPFKWRGSLEWGAGAIGDMGCHLMDPLFYALDLGMPQQVEAETEELTVLAWPREAAVKYTWQGHAKHGDLTMTWYEGKKADGSPRQPALPPELEGVELTKGGWFIIGTEGVIYNGADQCKNPQIFPEKRRAEFLAQPLEQKYERSPSAGDPQNEWTLAIKAGKEFPFMSNFDYAVPLTELGMIGGLAMRCGIPIGWDSAKLEVPGLPEASQFIKRPKYRKGWEYSADKI